ncbi:hypothetical protein PR048_007963 [Dryococelus australis]|uniref:Uncharacterized protein n=1 Tax=Dryococelus australis TaxID=614101 RepID=A0ABQ9HXE2_9NEOP|nr:hypothetical protein PR048_007963 [Dryococelus australis]
MHFKWQCHRSNSIASIVAMKNDNNFVKFSMFSLLPTQSYVKGETAHVTESLQLTTENYDITPTLLKSRFRNKHLIVQAHIKALFDQPLVERYLLQLQCAKYFSKAHQSIRSKHGNQKLRILNYQHLQNFPNFPNKGFTDRGHINNRRKTTFSDTPPRKPQVKFGVQKHALTRVGSTVKCKLCDTPHPVYMSIRLQHARLDLEHESCVILDTIVYFVIYIFHRIINLHITAKAIRVCIVVRSYCEGFRLIQPTTSMQSAFGYSMAIKFLYYNDYANTQVQANQEFKIYLRHRLSSNNVRLRHTRNNSIKIYELHSNSKPHRFATDHITTNCYSYIEYNNLGHVELVPESELPSPNHTFYLSPHSVDKETRTTAKIQKHQMIRQSEVWFSCGIHIKIFSHISFRILTKRDAFVNDPYCQMWHEYLTL